MKECPYCRELIGDNITDKCPVCFESLSEIYETDRPIKVTTTDSIEGYKIIQYLKCVYGTDMYLAESGEGLFDQEGTVFESAQERMIQRARVAGANAIVGTNFEITSPGGVKFMLVVATGTAVIVKKQT